MAGLQRWASDHWKTLKGPLGFTRKEAPHATTISRAAAKFSLEQFRDAFARWIVSIAGPLSAVTASADGKTSKQGRCHRTPALGWSEFTCDYWGPDRDDWEVDSSLDLEIPSMLASVWDRPLAGAYAATFVQGVRVQKGVLTYAE